jgi:hypothetical protein
MRWSPVTMRCAYNSEEERESGEAAPLEAMPSGGGSHRERGRNAVARRCDPKSGDERCGTVTRAGQTETAEGGASPRVLFVGRSGRTWGIEGG